MTNKSKQIAIENEKKVTKMWKQTNEAILQKINNQRAKTQEPTKVVQMTFHNTNSAESSRSEK